MFNVYALEAPGEGKFLIPRLNSKKSRFGCKRCRDRRVKATKPKCQHCKRHGATCIYNREPGKQPSASIPSLTNKRSGLVKQVDDATESRERRLLEVGLMRNYVTKTGPSICPDDPTQPIFAAAILELSLQCDALLYTVYSITALHQAWSSRSQDDSSTDLDVHRRYLSLALREHQSLLRNITSENIDAICLTSAFLRFCAYAMLQVRKLQPYTPPTQWLMMVSTTRALYEEAWGVAKDKPNSIAYLHLSSYSITRDNNNLWEQCKFSDLAFAHVMTRLAQDVELEPWDAETKDAYEEALRFLGSVKSVVDDGAAKFLVLRHLLRFPLVIPTRLLDLVLDCQPRSLVVLAHYFALLVPFAQNWYIGSGPKQEVLAIADKMSSSPRWRRLLDWPLQMVNA
ncbi:Zn(2)-Cys(6) zinc finger domain protein [Metarhizium robertsii]|uniref:Zn(2)-Cys(6) zinc finger domain protein n=1 Tax=Metarhizium robertsii TaxID=568076 RepID=A0A014PJJ2_9HYPO|nr:Zn(2)-Cys(6) zinc finger domain protein [Metarhizium robertsii]